MVALQKSDCSLQSVPSCPISTRPSWRDNIIAESQSMCRLLELVERVAPSSISVLLLGETGTGKEVLARALHEASGRPGPFIPFNCAALPSTLAESEFLGHVRGAFTGAYADKPGLLEEAHNGTLFLDEIADLDPLIQAKLLRVLDDGFVRRVGGNRFIPVDFRLITATNRNLFVEIQAGRFREDLYHRIAGITMIVPPLRDRPDDILPMADLFLKQDTDGRSLSGLSEEATGFLLSHPWPGNVRELRQAVKRAAILGGDILEPEDFQENLHAGQTGLPPCLSSSFEWMSNKTWSEIKDAVLTWACEHYGGPNKAARALGLARSTIFEWRRGKKPSMPVSETAAPFLT